MRYALPTLVHFSMPIIFKLFFIHIFNIYFYSIYNFFYVHILLLSLKRLFFLFFIFLYFETPQCSSSLFSISFLSPLMTVPPLLS